MLRKIIVLFIILAAYLSAETLVFQNGLNGYSGTEDVTIFNSSKSEQYSLYNNGGDYSGDPDDEIIIPQEFCC